jgi:hypothetical protein
MSVHEERRGGKSQRIPFDAIVEIGGEIDVATAFEAQGIDLSASGMQMRTAYLPDLGQSLLCRFGSGAQEISAAAEVVWRREGTRGGEFGVRFTNLDGASEAALWDMCGVNREDPAELRQPAGQVEVSTGTRVRLHIDGLGSPMKARVRAVSGGDLLVGSNLEFLRVGRTLELEDVDRGGKRPAHIDRVDVELDRASNVPQLVVTLRYDDVDAAAPVYVRATAEQMSAAASPELAPVELSPVPPQVAIATADEVRSSRPSLHSEAERREALEDIQAAKLMRSKVSAAAADMLPKFAALGARAKTTVGLLVAKASERTRRVDVDARRRTTAPPPGGALHATGKRVFREGGDEDPAGARSRDAARPTLGRPAMLAAGGASALLVVVTALAFHKSAPPPASALSAATTIGTDATVTTAASVAPLGGALAVADPGAAPPLQANVPLFGPTTLSTTEPVVAGPVPGAGATLSPALLAAAGIPGAAGSLGAAAGQTAGGSPEAVDDRHEGNDDHGRSGKPSGWVPAFTHGRLSHPNVFRVKTDGAIAEMHGGRMSTGFTVTVPGRRALDTGVALAAKDPRIASVHVTNGAKGAELLVLFKDDVPSYAVRAKGHELQIALGRVSDGDDRATATLADKDRAPEPVHATRGLTAVKAKPEHHRAKKGR